MVLSIILILYISKYTHYTLNNISINTNNIKKM